MPEPAPRRGAADRVPSRTAWRWMLVLSALLGIAQLADAFWPRDDPRAGSPAGIVAMATLFLLLALYPTGRPVPRWAPVVAAAAALLWIAVDLAGPHTAARFAWPLPLAPLLLLLVIGGQGYRYVRRSSAAEREATRWPLLGVLVALTLFVPADLVSVALTGGTIGDPPPALSVIAVIAMLLPSAGFVAGLVAPPTELVDRMLALWLAVVLSAAALGIVFATVFVVSGSWMPEPWHAVVAAGAAVVVGLWVVPLARRVARRAVFRSRAEQHAAVAALTTRLRSTLDAADLPAEVVEAVREATGGSGVVLRRSGQAGTWARAGAPGIPDDPGRYERGVGHLGLEVATLTVWPRPAESALASADRALIDALAEAAAPALHGARLASAFPELTERERQVLAGIVRGLPNSAIAARLGVSAKTVANYVSIVLTKLRVPDRERAAELARRRAAELG